MGCALHDHGHGHSHKPSEEHSHLNKNQENMNVRAALIHVISGNFFKSSYRFIGNFLLNVSRFCSVMWSFSGSARHLFQAGMVNNRPDLYLPILCSRTFHNIENFERRRSGKLVVKTTPCVSYKECEMV